MLHARSLPATSAVIRMSYTLAMRLREKILLLLALAFVSGGAAVSPPAAATGMHARASHGEIPLTLHIAAHPAPDRPAPCLDRHHPCGPGVIPASLGEPFSVGLTQRVSLAAPRGPEQVPVPDAVPPPRL
jgi:hypothetical protein